jgi:hypothetical protein
MHGVVFPVELKCLVYRGAVTAACTCRTIPKRYSSRRPPLIETEQVAGLKTEIAVPEIAVEPMGELEVRSVPRKPQCGGRATTRKSGSARCSEPSSSAAAADDWLRDVSEELGTDEVEDDCACAAWTSTSVNARTPIETKRTSLYVVTRLRKASGGPRVPEPKPQETSGI